MHTPQHLGGCAQLHRLLVEAGPLLVLQRLPLRRHEDLGALICQLLPHLRIGLAELLLILLHLPFEAGDLHLVLQQLGIVSCALLLLVDRQGGPPPLLLRLDNSLLLLEQRRVLVPQLAVLCLEVGDSRPLQRQHLGQALHQLVYLAASHLHQIV